MEFNQALQSFNEFRNNTPLENYSFIPELNKGFNVYDEIDRNILLKKFSKGHKSIYLVGLSNNIISKNKYNLSKLLGSPMFGKWTNKGKVFNDVSVLINDMSDKSVKFLAKYYNQKAIMKVSKNKVKEIYI